MANKTGEYGFTLIDASIVLLVIGILMVPILKKIDIEFSKRKMQQTNVRLETIDKAIEEYYFVFRNYPCPADPAKSPLDGDYGASVDCHTNGYLPGGAAGGTLSYGSVPFKELKIDEKTALDKWGNKIMYAVSTGLTTDPLDKFEPMDPTTASLTFMGWESTLSDPTDPGSPRIWTFREYSNPAGQGHYILISHGDNGAGGYTAQGILVEPCPSPPNITADAENCDGDNTFNLYKYADRENTAAMRTIVPGPTYFDDLTHFNTSTHTRMWNSASNPSDIFTGDIRVGVGKVPDVLVALDVDGNIKAEADVKAQSLCDGDGIVAASATACFESSLIAGSEPAMECDPTLPTTNPGKSLMGGIANSEVNCNPVTAYNPGSGFTPGSCPPGQYVNGINASGVTCGP